MAKQLHLYPDDHFKKKRDEFVKEWGAGDTASLDGESMRYVWDDKGQCFRIGYRLTFSSSTDGVRNYTINVRSPKLKLEGKFKDKASETNATNKLQLQLMDVVEQHYLLTAYYYLFTLPRSYWETPKLFREAIAKLRSVAKGYSFTDNDALRLFDKWNDAPDAKYGDKEIYIFVDAHYAISKAGVYSLVIKAHVDDKSGVPHRFEGEIPTDDRRDNLYVTEDALTYFICQYVCASTRKGEFSPELRDWCSKLLEKTKIVGSRALRSAAGRGFRAKLGKKKEEKHGSGSVSSEKRIGDFIIRVAKGDEVVEHRMPVGEGGIEVGLTIERTNSPIASNSQVAELDSEEVEIEPKPFV